MFLEFSDWLFFADVPANRLYSAEESAERCNCAWCRNFYQTVDKAYPNIRYFLSRFGMSIDAPVSLNPITTKLYQASYSVQGKILKQGSNPIFVDEIAITAEPDSEPDYFILDLGLMELPWVLNEPSPPLPESIYSDLFSGYHHK